MEGQLLDAQFIKELSAVVRHVRKNGLWAEPSNLGRTVAPASSVPIKNTEASAVPPYACMEIDGTVEFMGQNYVKIKKPTAAGVAFLFNGHTEIEASGYGAGHEGPLARAYKSSGTVTDGDRWGPTAGQWYLSANAGGQFVAVGEDDIVTGGMRVVILPPHRRLVHFKSKVGGIAAFNTGTLAMGSATCDIYNSSSVGVLSDSGSDETVYNAAGSFAANTFGVAGYNEAGLLVAIVEKC